jgi:L-fuconolactonase
MTDTPIIDTHLHLCDKDLFSYRWLSDVPGIDRSFLLDDYDAATGSLNVVGMVYMEYVTDTWDQAIQEAEWVYGLSQREPRIRGIIARAPLHLGDGTRAHLDRLRRNPLVKGVRHILQFEDALDFCLRPEFVAGTRMLADYGFVCHICITHEHLPYVVQLVDRCPKVRFALDHVGKPAIRLGLQEPWQTHMQALAVHPNVVCKISGMITEADHTGWTKEDLAPYIHHTVACFGFKRLMFGGDWPVCTLAGQLTDWVAALRWVLEAYSTEERAGLFHDNAVRVYALEV